MTNGLTAVVRLIDAFTEKTGAIIAWLNIGMVVGTVAVVLLRYVFNNSSIALQESVLYMHGFVFMIASAYTLKHDEHVRVDILYQRFSVRGKAIVNLLGTLLLLFPLIIYIGIESWPYIAQSWRIREVSPETAGLPAVFILKSLILALVFVLGAQGIAEVLRNLCLIIAPSHSSGQKEQD
ncbi:TRAP transporter small permease subunit [Hahella aquimaris]|uniref:TRAP transporter small permease subunit n=1 Tax=Hahella sp. HNIBRBA332 TaxID=3015983 RepID=UPI00273C0B94|nr:TRAP transporter small permease subunit [Hahella sp. HNIBRBA332]WLQ12478.1 TRAP transporter small permease subunit [Hahella sp. HNIBRBA332]